MKGDMKITDYKRAGEYFKKLALGLEPLPDSTHAAVTALAANGVEVTKYKTVKFHRDTEDEINFVIGREDWISQTIDGLQNKPDPYSFPSQIGAKYEDYFKNPGDYTGPEPAKVQNRLGLFDCRLADYCLGRCK